MATSLVPGEARRAVRSAGGWIAGLGRAGYAAKGVVYGLVAVLAIMTARAGGSRVSGKREALTRLTDAPLGEALLATVGVGLFGYAIWRMLSAIFDLEGLGAQAKGALERVGHAVSAVVHGGLGVSALALALSGRRPGSDDGQARTFTAELMSRPFGQWLVAGIGIAVLGVAVAQFVESRRAHFLSHFERGRMSAGEWTWAERLGRVGHAARGVVFAIMGGFLVIAAFESQPSQARGLGGALATLARQPYGPALLGVVAAGLLAYAAFALFQSRYRRMGAH
jgi:hypothetical protein